jgi:arsenate reductase
VLLGNAMATGLALAAMILAFAPVSGAHLNPVVTMAGRLRGEMATAGAIAVVGAQVAGAVAGTIVANLTFGLPAVTTSTSVRSGAALWLSEAIATFGLVVVVRAVGPRGRPGATAAAVAAYVGTAIVFTPSTCFANPAVTLGRTLTDTFTGIAPASVPPFIAAQVLGALAAVAVDRLLLAPPTAAAP